MGLGWNWTGWQRAAAAAQRRFDATRPRINGLRDWLNTGWTYPDASPSDHTLDGLDEFEAPPPPCAPRAPARQGSDHPPRETRP